MMTTLANINLTSLLPQNILEQPLENTSQAFLKRRPTSHNKMFFGAFFSFRAPNARLSRTVDLQVLSNFRRLEAERGSRSARAHGLGGGTEKSDVHIRAALSLIESVSGRAASSDEVRRPGGAS